MEIMTWKQFKDFVDKKLVEHGCSEDAKIEYIDISYPGEYGEISVFAEPGQEIAIS